MGQLFGLAIKLKQTISIELDIFLLYMITHDDFQTATSAKIKSIIEDYDPEFLDTFTPYKCYNDDFTKVLEMHYCTYDADGEPIELQLQTQEHLADETTKKIKDLVRGNDLETITKFVEGFRSQINIKTSKINRLPLKSLNELICGIKNVNYDVLIEHLKFENFENEDEKNSIKEMIQINIRKDPKYIEKLLLAMTGTTKLSVSGYGRNPLRIEVRSDAKIPFELHTCFNQMIINKNTFDVFYTSQDKTTTDLYQYFSSDMLTRLSNDFSTA